MDHEKALEMTIDYAADEIVKLVENGLSGNLLRAAIKGALRGIRTIVRDNEITN